MQHIPLQQAKRLFYEARNKNTCTKNYHQNLPEVPGLACAQALSDADMNLQSSQVKKQRSS